MCIQFFSYLFLNIHITIATILMKISERFFMPLTGPSIITSNKNRIKISKNLCLLTIKYLIIFNFLLLRKRLTCYSSLLFYKTRFSDFQPLKIRADVLCLCRKFPLELSFHHHYISFSTSCFLSDKFHRFPLK